MSFLPEIPARASCRYVEISCPTCGDVRFYKRRHIYDGPGVEGIVCAACRKAPVRTRTVSAAYVLLHDPLKRRCIEGEPSPGEAMHTALKEGKLFIEQDPDEAE